MAAFVIGYGEWNLASPKLPWRPNAPFTSLTIDFDNKTGKAEQGNGIGRPMITTDLFNVVTPTPTTFRANYAFGANKGRMDGEISATRRLDLTFIGSVETSVMAEPIKTLAPRVIKQAIAHFRNDVRHFASTVMQADAKAQQDYLDNTEKYGKAILSDLKHDRISRDEALREIDLLRRAVSGLGASGAILARMEAAGAAAAGTPARWGAQGTLTVMEAFGRPDLADSAWVHLAPSQAASSIRSAGVTTSSHSSWARWGEIKNLKYGDLIFRIGPMSLSAQSDLATMAVAAADAPIREVKGLYGFRVEGEARVTIPVRVIESGYALSLAEAQRVAGKTLVDLEELFTSKRYGEVLAGRPGGAGKRLFERLSLAEQAQVRLDIVDSVNPNPTPVAPKRTRWAKIGRGLLVVALAVSIYRIATAEDRLKQTAREAIGFAGGAVAGAAVGATVSAAAPQLSPVIVGIAAFVGGLLGALGADFVFEWLDNQAVGDLEAHY